MCQVLAYILFIYPKSIIKLVILSNHGRKVNFNSITMKSSVTLVYMCKKKSQTAGEIISTFTQPDTVTKDCDDVKVSLQN